jgi:hypothetical protein
LADCRILVSLVRRHSFARAEWAGMSGEPLERTLTEPIKKLKDALRFRSFAASGHGTRPTTDAGARIPRFGYAALNVQDVVAGAPRCGADRRAALLAPGGRRIDRTSIAQPPRVGLVSRADQGARERGVKPTRDGGHPRRRRGLHRSLKTVLESGHRAPPRGRISP